VGRQRQWGFSLLELLVTLFVIVLVTSLVTLNVGTGGAEYRLQRLVESMADTANYALDEAQFAGWDYGLLITREDRAGQSYYRLRWLERGPERWRPPLSGKEVFADIALDPGLELELELDGALQDQDVFSPRVDAPAPQLVFYASGETLPGLLDLLDPQGNLLWRLEWDLLGNFRALRQGIDEEEPL
jgi:prepilin-type N-terminal cleavage/methylation domain-containing protein